VWPVSVRPTLTVAGLALGDYLLWKWSLGSHQDVLALIAGLSLPPLGAAFVWLAGLLAVRALARQTRRAALRAPRLHPRTRRRTSPARSVRLAAGAPRGAAPGAETGSGDRAKRRSSRRLAA
jgi:hypothetical protein